MLQQKHLIAGEWVDGQDFFENSPVDGKADKFPLGSVEQMNIACEAAEDAFWSFGYSDRSKRAEFLVSIAEEIEKRSEALSLQGVKETGLPKARLEGERGRTTGQLRLFAEHILKADYLDCRHDKALPERTPAPRPDMRLMQRPIGPVAVFGASNFPLAFSTAGGDTAAAFAAGCPVVVKAHQAHPGVSDIIAQAINAARLACDLHPGVFSHIHGEGPVVGKALVEHPYIKAVGFTGSLRGGRALFDLCAARPEPIPFFGELGSINPVFVLDEALTSRGAEIAKNWAASLTMGAGQFCTNPGIIIINDDKHGDTFIETARDALNATAPQTMLTNGIAAAYRDGGRNVLASKIATEVLPNTSTERQCSPHLFVTDTKNWLENDLLSEEVFGPFAIIIRASGLDDKLKIAKKLKGQLTCTIQLDAGDTQSASELLPILERKAGRVLANGFPTGVEVCDTMVHGGPYPASTNFGATSVGTMSIRRFLRPVCYQNIPESLLPKDLK